MHCYVQSSQIVCEHTGLPEWEGTEILNITVRDRYDDTYFSQFNLSAIVVPVDDSVVKTSDFPSVQMEEDSQAFVYNFTNYFEDPEGANVTILNASSSTGLNLTWTEHNVAIVPFINWHGNTTIGVYVWDGTAHP